MTLTLKKRNNKKNKKTKKQRGGAKPFGQPQPSAPPKKWGPFSLNPFKRKPAPPPPVQQATLQRKSSVSSPVQQEQPNLKRTQSMIAAFNKYGTYTPFGEYGHKSPRGPEHEQKLASKEEIRDAMIKSGFHTPEQAESMSRKWTGAINRNSMGYYTSSIFRSKS